MSNWAQDLDDALDGPSAAADAPADPAALPPLHFPSLDRFVEDYLAKIYRRDITMAGTRWCPEWWNHGEAIARLESLWRAWELLRLDPGEGASNWWLMHADPHMRVLLSDIGPFKNCRNGKHSEERSMPLPTAPPPNGMFTP